MKRKLLLTANIIGIILILFVIIAGRINYSNFIQSFSKSVPDSSAIGIIGGADRPTAIFVSGNFDLNTATLLFLLPLLLVGVLLIFNVVYLKKLRVETTE